MIPVPRPIQFSKPLWCYSSLSYVCAIHRPAWELRSVLALSLTLKVSVCCWGSAPCVHRWGWPRNSYTIPWGCLPELLPLHHLSSTFWFLGSFLFCPPAKHLYTLFIKYINIYSFIYTTLSCSSCACAHVRAEQWEDRGENNKTTGICPTLLGPQLLGLERDFPLPPRFRHLWAPCCRHYCC